MSLEGFGDYLILTERSDGRILPAELESSSGKILRCDQNEVET